MVLAVNLGEPAPAVKAFVTKMQLTFPHVLDPTRKFMTLLPVPGTPTTFLVDRQGRILGGGAGYRDWASPAALQLVEHVLAAR